MLRFYRLLQIGDPSCEPVPEYGHLEGPKKAAARISVVWRNSMNQRQGNEMQ